TLLWRVAKIVAAADNDGRADRGIHGTGEGFAAEHDGAYAGKVPALGSIFTLGNEVGGKVKKDDLRLACRLRHRRLRPAFAISENRYGQIDSALVRAAQKH